MLLYFSQFTFRQITFLFLQSNKSVICTYNSTMQKLCILNEQYTNISLLQAGQSFPKTKHYTH